MATNDAKAATTHLEDTDGDLKGGTGVHIAGADTDAGLAVVDQLEVIPTSGERIPVSKWEYYTFILFYFQNNGSPIGNTGGSLRMKLISDQFPDGIINWGGQQMAMNAFLLDTNGILFAVNLFLMLVIGPYADYGTWRPYILMSGFLPRRIRSHQPRPSSALPPRSASSPLTSRPNGRLSTRCG